MTATRTLPRHIADLNPTTGAHAPKLSRSQRRKARKAQRRLEQVGHQPTKATWRPDNTGGTRRNRTYEHKERMAVTVKADVILSSPDFWNVACALPGNTRTPGKNGRPNDYPTWVMLFVVAMTPLLGSRREVFTYLTDVKLWLRWRETAHQHLPEGFDPAGSTPPKDHHLDYWLKAKWDSPAWAEHRDNAVKAFRGTALHLAQGLGHLPSDHPMYYKRPATSQWVAFDGTVYPGPSNKTFDDADRRHDPASGWHNKYGDDKVRVWGSKYVFASMRSEDWHGRIVLDFQHVKGPNNVSGIGDEGAVIEQMAYRIKAQAPGMCGLIVDGILKGNTIARLAARGLFTINWPTAKSHKDRATQGTHNDTREEKFAKVYVWTHDRRNGTECKHDIWALGTQLHERVPDAKGREAFVPLETAAVQTRKNADSTQRHYLRANVQCLGRKVVAMVPMYHQPENGPVINRGEYIRLYAPGTWQFGALY